MAPSLRGARVLVAGGSGFIGSNLLLRLIRDGAIVRATVHEQPPQVADPRVEFLQADLTDLEDCRRAVSGLDYVFMCAAATSGAAVMTANPLAHVTPNVVMNTYMLAAAYEMSVKKFLFVSSSAAYPATGERPVREEEFFLDEPYDVYYAVGWMKRYAEVLCKIYALRLNRPMPVVVIRPSNVYGPFDKYDFKTSHMQAALIRRVVERQKPIVVWGTGDDVRDLIFVDDLIDGMLLAFDHCERYLAVNIATGRGHSVREVLEILLEIDAFSDATIEFDPSKPRTIPSRIVDTSFAAQAIGFTARTSLKEGLSKTMRWYRSAFPKR